MRTTEIKYEVDEATTRELVTFSRKKGRLGGRLPHFPLSILLMLGLLAGCDDDEVKEEGKSAVSVQSISLHETTLTLSIGDSTQLHVVFNPENPTNKNVSWVSDNPSLVTVDNSGRILAVSEGEATIVATTEDGNKTAACQVTVIQKDMSPTLNPNRILLSPIRLSAVATLRVSGFANEADSDNAQLEIGDFNGLSFGVASSVQGSEKIFNVTVVYDGITAFPEGTVPVSLKLNAPQGNAYADNMPILHLEFRDGSPPPPIPVYQDNVEAFNSYANMGSGLMLYYELAEDVVLPTPPEGESNWTPIGTKAAPFMGHFDGGDFSISGLSFDHSFDYLNGPRNFQGLFGYIGASAVIENIGMTNIHFSHYNDGYAGGVVGWSEGGTVQNCYVTGAIRTTGGGYVGGVVGFNHTGTVQDCHVTASVHGYVVAGGVVGANYDGIVQNCSSTGGANSSFDTAGGVVGVNTYGTVRNCYATGGVGGGGIRGGGGAGGVAGINTYGTLEDCSFTGGVGSTHDAGGVVAHNSGIVRNCHATGGVGGGSRSGDIGGVVGVNAGGIVQNCYATNEVIGHYSVGGVAGRNSGTVQDCYATNSVGGDYNIYVGGVVGYNSGTVQRCYATGAVTGGSTAAGGVAGYNDGAVRSCYATGAVTGGNNAAGGVAGYNGGTMQSCYATGDVNGNEHVGGVVGDNGGIVRSCYATGAVTGNSHVGGVAGYNAEGRSPTASIIDCAALSLNVVQTDNNPDTIGRVLGNSNGFLSRNYARTDMVLTVDGMPHPPGANDLSLKDGEATSLYNTKEFWDRESSSGWVYSGWDFLVVWNWTGTLPTLRGVGGLQNPRVEE